MKVLMMMIKDMQKKSTFPWIFVNLSYNPFFSVSSLAILVLSLLISSILVLKATSRFLFLSSRSFMALCKRNIFSFCSIFASKTRFLRHVLSSVIRSRWNSEASCLSYAAGVDGSKCSICLK